MQLDFEILDGEFKRKVDLRKDKYALQNPPQMITGREIVRLIYLHAQKDHESGHRNLGIRRFPEGGAKGRQLTKLSQ